MGEDGEYFQFGMMQKKYGRYAMISYKFFFQFSKFTYFSDTLNNKNTQINLKK